MLIRIPAGGDCHESEVTPEAIYRSRRRFVQGAALAGAAVGVPLLARAAEQYPGVPASPAPPWFVGKLGDARWRAVVAQSEAITPYADATQYNNFYEFGPNKGDPARYAAELKVEPWTVLVDGEVEKPGRYSL
ncbi:MAG TPA: mononuclear molybdenum enzyme YedY, partial [Pseudomonas sp.]|nr:mononuclear molybdenum enzyme YedY [Pseudomonas sp.]